MYTSITLLHIRDCQFVHSHSMIHAPVMLNKSHNVLSVTVEYHICCRSEVQAPIGVTQVLSHGSLLRKRFND